MEVFIASLGGSIQMAQVLIDRGADVNRIDNEEKSVLMVYIWSSI